MRPSIIPAGPPPAIAQVVDSDSKTNAVLDPRKANLRGSPMIVETIAVQVRPDPSTLNHSLTEWKMRRNGLRERWQSGKNATNCWLALGHAFTAELIAHQGWDSVTIDMQHGLADHAEMCAMLQAVSATEAVPIVRVPWNEPGTVMRALDAGAMGVICPNVDTAEECERFVGACRYAPLGYRSVGPRRAMLYGGDYMAKANEELLAIVQVESAKALSNVREIASVKGLDMLYVGPSDLGLSLGREPRPDQTDPVVVEAIDTILKTAKEAGLRAGIYCSAVDYAQAMLEKGFDLVTVTSDGAMIGTGAAIARRFAR
jgi:4-hydroxy-2-oxoheptanedioate aldolase